MNDRRAYHSAVRETLERELKLDVNGAFALPELPGSPLPERTFTSTYHDTPARSLGRAGITLRRRVENGTSLWQLKLPRGGRWASESSSRSRAGRADRRPSWRGCSSRTCATAGSSRSRRCGRTARASASRRTDARSPT